MEFQSIRFCTQDLGMQDAYECTTIYSDNQATVDWAAACTNKGTKHLNLRENYVRKLHQNGTTKVTHIPGVINASDLFTKELKDAAHFHRCRDSMMVSRANFDRRGHLMPSHRQKHDDLPYYTIRSPKTLEASRSPQLCRLSAAACASVLTRTTGKKVSYQQGPLA
jgi:hypothetical protein